MKKTAYLWLIVIFTLFTTIITANLAEAEVNKDNRIVITKSTPEVSKKDDTKSDKNKSEPANNPESNQDKSVNTEETNPNSDQEPKTDDKTAPPTDEETNSNEPASSDRLSRTEEFFDPEQIYFNRYLKLQTKTYSIFFPKDLREGLVSIKERQRYGLDFALENVFTINNIWGQNIYRFPADIKSAPEAFSEYWQAMIDTLLATPGAEQDGEATIYGTKFYQWRHAEFLLTVTPKGDLVPLKTITIQDKSFKMPDDKSGEKSKTPNKSEPIVNPKPEEKQPATTEKDKPKTKKVPITDQPIIKVRLSIYSTDADGVFYSVIFFRYDDLINDDTEKMVREIIGSFKAVSKEY